MNDEANPMSPAPSPELEQARQWLFERFGNRLRRGLYWDEVEQLLTDYAKTHQRQGWVRVSERLPEIGSQVIAWKPLGLAEATVYSADSHRHRTVIRGDGQWWDCGRQITHWMPLPEGPKEDNAESD